MKADGLSLGPAVSVVVSSMVGVGVFTSVGYQLAAIPSAFPILSLWALGGLVSLCGALCYAELVAMRPRSGGEYHLLGEFVNPLAGFLAGWVSVVAGFAAPIAALGMAFGTYLAGIGVPAPPAVSGALLVVGVAVLHAGPLRAAGRFLAWTTALKVLLIVVFVVAALVFAGGDGRSLAPVTGDLSWLVAPEFASAMVFVMFAYSGWNGAAYVAADLRRPARLVPFALTAGTALVTVLYVALNAVFLWSTPWDAMAGEIDVGIVAGRACFGETGGRLVGALIAFGIVSTMAGYTWSGFRVIDRMAQDHPPLRALARVNRWGAPHLAIAAQTALALAMLLTGGFDAVVNYLMALLQFSSLLTVAAVVLARRTMPFAERPFRVPLYPVPPLLFIAVTAWVLVFQCASRPVESALGAATIAVGALLFAWSRRSPTKH